MEIVHPPVEKLIDLTLEVGMVPDSKFHYQWQNYANWQLDALQKVGMKSEHALLDVGCGPLRFGSSAIQFLDAGNYCGMDGFEPYIRLGKKVIELYGVTKEYQVEFSRLFEFERFNKQFDFGIAQSVFTHLSKPQIEHCCTNLKKAMKPGGKFLFTNINATQPYGFLYGGRQPMIAGNHCDVDYYRDLGQKVGFEITADVVEHDTQQAHLLTF